jgi:hypothetical protein
VFNGTYAYNNTMTLSRRAEQELRNNPRLRRKLERLADEIEVAVKAAAPVRDPEPRRTRSYPGRAVGTLRDAIEVKVVNSSKTSSGFAITVRAPSDAVVFKAVTKGRDALVINAKPENKEGLFFFSTQQSKFYGARTNPESPKLRQVTSGPIKPNPYIQTTLDEFASRTKTLRPKVVKS